MSADFLSGRLSGFVVMFVFVCLFRCSVLICHVHVPPLLRLSSSKTNPTLHREKWIVGSRGAKCYYKFFKARQKLHQSTPYRYKYNLGLANITSVDEDDIGRMVSQKALWHKLAGRPMRPLHLLSFNGREGFCFGTKVLPFPANINSVRIGLMVVSPEGAEAEANEGKESSSSDDEDA